MSGKKTNVGASFVLPDILKKFTNDAISTQPDDVMEWASLYFSALNKGQPLPVKRNTERGSSPNAKDLTTEILAAMNSKFNGIEIVTRQMVEDVWTSFHLAEYLLGHIFRVGCFGEEFEWIKVFALCCFYLGGTIKNAMAHACSILNTRPGSSLGDACVPFETFRVLFTYLGVVDREVPQTRIDKALLHLEAKSKFTNGVVRVSDFIDTRTVCLT